MDFSNADGSPTDKATRAQLMEQFYEAFWWLRNHPLFTYQGKLKGKRCFPDNLYIETQKVDPETRQIEDDEARNTHVEVWLEVIVYEDGSKDEWGYNEWEGMACHDWELDCGGDSFEEVLLN